MPLPKQALAFERTSAKQRVYETVKEDVYKRQVQHRQIESVSRAFPRLMRKYGGVLH